MSFRILGRTTSINVRKVLWTLAEIGVPFQHESDWGNERPTSLPEYRALNPNALMPVIEDENGILWESNTICRYLANKHKRTDLLPADPGPRSKVEMWMDWQVADLNPAWSYALMALLRKNPAFNDPEQIKSSITRWNARMKILDAHLAATGPYMTGTDFTLADIVLGLAAHRWQAMDIERVEAAHVKAWLDRVRTRPSGAPYLTAAFP